MVFEVRRETGQERPGRERAAGADDGSLEEVAVDGLVCGEVAEDRLLVRVGEGGREVGVVDDGGVEGRFELFEGVGVVEHAEVVREVELDVATGREREVGGRGGALGHGHLLLHVLGHEVRGFDRDGVVANREVVKGVHPVGAGRRRPGALDPAVRRGGDDADPGDGGLGRVGVGGHGDGAHKVRKLTGRDGVGARVAAGSDEDDTAYASELEEGAAAGLGVRLGLRIGACQVRHRSEERWLVEYDKSAVSSHTADGPVQRGEAVASGPRGRRGRLRGQNKVNKRVVRYLVQGSAKTRARLHPPAGLEPDASRALSAHGTSPHRSGRVRTAAGAARPSVEAPTQKARGGPGHPSLVRGTSLDRD